MKSILLLCMTLSFISPAFSADKTICADRSKNSYYADVTSAISMIKDQVMTINLSYRLFRSYPEVVDSLKCLKPSVNPTSAEHASFLYCSSDKYELILEKVGTNLVADLFVKNGNLVQGDISCLVTTH